MIQTLETGEKLIFDNECLHSVYPPESLFGFTYWSLMVPPEKPKNVLILGYGDGTVAGLIKKIWGNDVYITGVDKKDPQHPEFADNFFMTDAYTFLEDYAPRYDKYDYVVIDLFNGKQVSPIVFDEGFMKRLSDICTHRLSVNISDEFMDKFVEKKNKSIYEKYFDLSLVKNVAKQYVVFFKSKVESNA